MSTILNKKNIAFLVLLLGVMVTLVGCNTGDTDGTVVSKTDTNTNTTAEVAEETDTNTTVEVAINTNEAEASEVVSEETNITEETTSEEQSDIPEDWVKYENEEYGFSVFYPQDWIYEVFDDEFYFGTPESKAGGYIWGIYVHEPNEMELVISQMGMQFNDREEIREDILVSENIVATMITVTTKKYDNWISKGVFFENENKLFVIGNGAVDTDSFETFYNSFNFTEL